MKFSDPFQKIRAAIAAALAAALLFALGLGLLHITGFIPGTELAGQKKALAASAAEAQRRAQTYEGVFYAANGTPLTEAEAPGRPARLLYPSLGRLIGYRSDRYGSSGLRLRWQDAIQDGGKDDRGAAVYTTIDPELSELLYAMMAGLEECAAVVIDANSGAVLACVSKQQGIDFDGNDIDSRFPAYQKMDGFLLDKSITACEPGGSILKLVTASAVLEAGIDQTYHDTGSEATPGSLVKNFNGTAMGDLDLNAAVVKSSNCYFASKAMEIGPAAVLETFRAFGFEENVVLEDLGIRIRQSVEPAAGQDLDALARVAFGYSTTVSPLMAAAMYESLLHGTIYQPYFVRLVEQDGEHLYQAETRVLGRPVENAEDLAALQGAFAAAADSYGLESVRYDEIYAKTGTSDRTDGDGNNIWMAAAIRDGETGAAYTICVMRKAPAGVSSHDLNDAVNHTIAFLEKEVYTG